jgi:hypothetical protein
MNLSRPQALIIQSARNQPKYTHIWVCLIFMIRQNAHLKENPSRGLHVRSQHLVV